MYTSERLDRLEDALLDLATALTEGVVPWLSFMAANEAEDASERLASIANAVGDGQGSIGR